MGMHDNLEHVTSMRWPEIAPLVEHFKKNGIEQYINAYNRVKHISGQDQKWGEEMEYTILKFDHANKKVRVSNSSQHLLKVIHDAEKENANKGVVNSSHWEVEFCSFQLEAIPSAPHASDMDCFLDVERIMRERRAEAKQFLAADEALLSGSFPALGTPHFFHPPSESGDNDTQWSAFHNIDHCMFPGLSQFMIAFGHNVPQRRGEKVAMNVPIYKDAHTPHQEDLACLDGVDSSAALPGHIYMDHMVFGEGLCCLQVTLQCRDESEARWLCDQLTPLTPLLLALTASTPIYRGWLSDVDARWDAIGQSVDDRTRAEREKGAKGVRKTRYSSPSCYVSTEAEEFNDVPVEVDSEIVARLVSGGLDVAHARHIAHLFYRDPLQLYAEQANESAEETNHMDSFLNRTWYNMRLKLPVDENLGWRVEIRTPEIQLTDFENAAFCCFMVLTARMLLSTRRSLLVPISLIEDNTTRSQKRDAVNSEKLHFRVDASGAIEQLSCDQIVNGGGGFDGVLPLIRDWLETQTMSAESRRLIDKYLSFISRRASGSAWTGARWMRAFVASHPAYQGDSRVPDETVYDMMKEIEGMASGEAAEASAGQLIAE